MISHFLIIGRDLTGNEIHRDQGSTPTEYLGRHLMETVDRLAQLGEFHITVSSNAIKEKPQ